MGLKLKTRTMFPARVTVQTPILLSKLGIHYDFSIDVDALFAAPTITRPNTVGVVDGSNANAGSVGEYIESNIANGAPVAAGTTGNAKTMTSITLTPGDWDVAGVISWIPAATTTLTAHYASISLTTNAIDFTFGRVNVGTLPSAVTGVGNTTNSNPVMPCRFNVSASTIIYLVGQAVYGVSTLGMYGNLRARRIR